MVLGALTTAAADDRPARSGFWRIEYFGYLYPGSDHDHAWLLDGGALYRLDRFGGQVAMSSLKEIDFFSPIDGTLSGWAASNNDTQTQKLDHKTIQYIDDNGAVVFSTDIPWCDMNKGATESYLWVTCANSVIRIARHETPAIRSFKITGDTPQLITFDGGRGAWISTTGNVLRAYPEAADSQRREKTFPFSGNLWLHPVDRTPDGRFLWLQPSDTAGERLFLLDVLAKDERWKQPVATTPYTSGLSVAPDGAYGYDHRQRIMTDRRRIPFPDDTFRFRPTHQPERAWSMSQHNDRFDLLRFTSDEKWLRTPIHDTRYLESAFSTETNVEALTQPGL